MAIFGKPPEKQSDKRGASARAPSGQPHVVSARELAKAAGLRASQASAGEPLGDSLRAASIIDWSTARSAIEVAQANPGLCDALENAALMFANGHDDVAREALEQGILADPNTRASVLAWLALFDLLQRANDREAFDRLAMHYVVQFERSAPAWEGASTPQADERSGGGGYIAVTGKLSGENPVQLEGLRRALEKCVSSARLDLASVTGFDDKGARMLAEDLARARRQRMDITIQRPEKLREVLDAAVRQGIMGGEGAWLLMLELMQWRNEQAAFDDRALEFAIAFEVSPPSWEPPPRAAGNDAVDPDARGAHPVAAARRSAEPADDPETLAWAGIMAGAATIQIARLDEFVNRHAVVPIDMGAVERVDFVCAGALLNAIRRIENQQKTVQIVGATPIVRALLLLIGLPPRHFVKKTA